MATNLNEQWQAVRKHGQRFNEALDDPRPQPDHAREGDAEMADDDNHIAGQVHQDDGSAREPPSEDDTFPRLVQRANDGDEEALIELKRVLDDNPDVWQQVGDLAAHARESVIRLIAGDNALLRDSLSRKADELLNQLSTEAASPLERLAVDRLVACWLQMQHADALAIQEHELPQAKYWSQRQDQAHRRYDKAVQQLTAIRELLPSEAKSVPEVDSELKINELTMQADPASKKATP